MRPDDVTTQDRRAAMATLALASTEELARAVETLAAAEVVVPLKPAEVGLVMVRGRIGGDGAPFNVGEATVSRCVVQISSGTVGHGYRLGRDTAAARASAILDALWQQPATRAAVERDVLAPIRARVAAERERAAARSAATRVEFFTMAREHP
jgi:alpha-D-ribose 1-methylphosphonate 5-triphosphate synthase subunit PhnG